MSVHTCRVSRCGDEQVCNCDRKDFETTGEVGISTFGINDHKMTGDLYVLTQTAITPPTTTSDGGDAAESAL